MWEAFPWEPGPRRRTADRKKTSGESGVCRPWSVGHKTCVMIECALAHIHFKWSLCNSRHCWQPGQRLGALETLGFFQSIDSVMSPSYPVSPLLCWLFAVAFWSSALLNPVFLKAQHSYIGEKHFYQPEETLLINVFGECQISDVILKIPVVYSLQLSPKLGIRDLIWYRKCPQSHRMLLSF